MRGTATAEAADVMRFRTISSISIESADTFFSSLEEKIEALEIFNKPHPLSVPMAIASLNKYISEDRYRIELRDLVMSGVERQFQYIYSLLSNVFVGDGRKNFYLQLERIESGMEMLVALFANGCFFGQTSQNRVWHDAILRVADISTQGQMMEGVRKLRRYPSSLLLYAGGIAAIALTCTPKSAQN